MAQLNHEPSMEDILASIKRIIAEDSEVTGGRGLRVRREMASVPSATDEEPGTALDAEPTRASISTIHPAFVASPEPFAPESGEPEAPEPKDDIHDVLELTSPMDDEASATEVAPVAEAAPEPESSEPEPEPVSEKAAHPAPAAPAPMEAAIHFDPLMSDLTAQASRNAFAALSQMQVRVEAGQENTLEGVVTDMLRPMLREWLDRELPGLVEKMVAAEIARVSRG